MFGDNVKPLVQLIPVYLNKMPWLKERFASQTAQPVNQFKSRWQRLWGRQVFIFLSNNKWFCKLWMDTQFKAPKFMFGKYFFLPLREASRNCTGTTVHLKHKFCKRNKNKLKNSCWTQLSNSNFKTAERDSCRVSGKVQVVTRNSWHVIACVSVSDYTVVTQFLFKIQC